jgi:uncharacterized OB-fold protein
MTVPTKRMAPAISPDTQFFWDGLKEHKLLIQHCTDCGTTRHPPRPMCPHCQSLHWDSVELKGTGVIYSFVLPKYPELPWFEYPYVVALIELDEGTRIVSNISDLAEGDVEIGQRVTVEYQEFEPDGLVLPQFRRIK